MRTKSHFKERILTADIMEDFGLDRMQIDRFRRKHKLGSNVGKFLVFSYEEYKKFGEHPRARKDK